LNAVVGFRLWANARGSEEMKAIIFGVAAVVIGTIAYVMIGIALASVS
jgi:hypothetical protein